MASSSSEINPLADKVRTKLDSIGAQLAKPDFEANLSQLLTKTGSVIAGGFVLGAINDSLSERSDLDIYVPHASAVEVAKFFASLKYCYITRKHLTHPYDHSFFYKNGILARFSYSLIYLDEEERERIIVEIDVMILKEDRSVIDCVSNFDFTFCEVWYNGKDVNGTHLAEALNKEGTMRYDYVGVFLAGNKFTMSRYTKYLCRGYKIILHYQTIEPEMLTPPEKLVDPELLIINQTIESYRTIPYAKECSSDERVASLLTSNMLRFIILAKNDEKLMDSFKGVLEYLSYRCGGAGADDNCRTILAECRKIKKLINGV